MTEREKQSDLSLKNKGESQKGKFTFVPLKLESSELIENSNIPSEFNNIQNVENGVKTYHLWAKSNSRVSNVDRARASNKRSSNLKFEQSQSHSPKIMVNENPNKFSFEDKEKKRVQRPRLGSGNEFKVRKSINADLLEEAVSGIKPSHYDDLKGNSFKTLLFDNKRSLLNHVSKKNLARRLISPRQRKDSQEFGISSQFSQIRKKYVLDDDNKSKISFRSNHERLDSYIFSSNHYKTYNSHQSLNENFRELNKPSIRPSHLVTTKKDTLKHESKKKKSKYRIEGDNTSRLRGPRLSIPQELKIKRKIKFGSPQGIRFGTQVPDTILKSSHTKYPSGIQMNVPENLFTFKN